MVKMTLPMQHPPLEASAEQHVKAMAKAIGFDDARITTAQAPDHPDAMAAYLAAGMHGEMGYLENRALLRSGPLSSPNLLDGAQSVILVALSYAPQNAAPTAPGESSRGIIARYARGTDYHLVMWEKLKELGTQIEATFPGTRTRGFADSGPLRERELAARAGLGWQGRHTNLISLDLGNWFFLGALLTTLPLAPDAPVDGHCGTCTRCLTACPTGALVAPLTLDARRCISYLTIELRGPIPRELRPLMGNRIFGCDDCLAACPWNERAQAGREARLQAHDSDAAFPDLVKLLQQLESDTWFRARFKNTPLLRTKRHGLRRNVCIALGNVAGEEAVAGLDAALTTDIEPLVRGAAAWALGQIQRRTDSKAARAALAQAVVHETNDDVREEISLAHV